MSRPSFSSPAGLPAPAGYSHVVSVPAGRLVLTSGQLGVAEDGTVAEGWEAQTRQVFDNLGRALAAEGAGWADVVKLTYFVTSVAEVAVIRAVRDEYVDTDRPPASSLVQVAGLLRPEFLLEVEATAWLP